MQTYEIHKVVSQKDLDELEHVNNIRYVEWVNEIAEAHWVSKSTKTQRSENFWVLLRHAIDYKGEAKLGDVLRLTTFVSLTKGVKSIRTVNIYNETSDQLITTSETTWCFMSFSTKKPTRIPDNIVQMFS